MNLIERAEGQAAAGGRVIFRATVAVVLAVLLLAGSSAHALSRTPRTRTHRLRGHIVLTHSSRAMRRSSVRRSVVRRPVSREAVYVRSSRERVDARRDSRARLREVASRESASRASLRSRERGRRGERLMETVYVVRHERTTAARRHDEIAERESSQPESSRVLTGDDFVRAAGAEPAPEPAVVETAAAAPQPSDDVPVADKSVLTAAALPADSEPVSAHRTLARTMAAHRMEAAHVPHFSPVEEAEITDEAVKPMVLPAIYSRGGRLLMPAPLRGSREILIHQNVMADDEGLKRIQTEEQLAQMVADHELTRLPDSISLHVNDNLPLDHRYALPWTVRFAENTARAFQARFGEPIEINSAVRTVEYQLHLERINGNAASVEGETASPHLTGEAIDIGKHEMTRAEIAWMRAYLLPLMQAGEIDVEEEFQQACFHISVYRSYMGGARHSMDLADEQPAAAAAAPSTTYAAPAVSDADEPVQ